MKDNVNIVSAMSLPAFWDQHFKGQIFFSSAFLAHLSKTNPADQKCFFGCKGSSVSVGGTIYSTKLSFCLGPLCFSSPVYICGIPMVYGSQAGFVPESCIADAAEAMDSIKPGFQIIIGLRQPMGYVKGWSWKRHLITVDIKNNWENFPQYMEAMRSDYRKQIAASRKKWKDVKIELKKGGDFTIRDYELFMDLHRSTKDKSNPLSMEFFRQIPIEHIYIKANHNGIELGWALLIPDDRILHLLFLGYDIPRNNKYDTYLNLLIESIKYTIENKYVSLKMGQTAELIKMRTGGTPSERYMLVRHTNPIINQIIKKTDIFNMRKYYQPLHVFKASENDLKKGLV